MTLSVDPTPLVARIKADLPPEFHAVLIIVQIPADDEEGFTVKHQRMASTLGPEFVGPLLARTAQDLLGKEDEWTSHETETCQPPSAEPAKGTP